MSRAKKIWLIAASALTVSGILLMVGALAAVGFDYKKLSTVSYLTVTEEISEEFDSVSIDVATADIEVIPSDGKDCRVVLYERKSDRFSASVEDKTLVIRRNGDKKWYEEIHIDFDSPKITAYLPKVKYDDFRIKCTTGDILIDSMEIGGDINITSTTGNVRLNETKVSGDIDISTTTGDISLIDSAADKDISVSCTTGDVKFDGADADAIKAHTTTGDISGTLLTDKSFSAHTTTGDISVPDTEGGSCELSTTTGDIRIKISD